jgi:hypothetical protein
MGGNDAELILIAGALLAIAIAAALFADRIRWGSWSAPKASAGSSSTTPRWPAPWARSASC